MTLPLELAPYFSGEALRFSATGLPEGLTINPDTGQVSGVLTRVEATTVTVTATNDAGHAVGSFGWTVTGQAQSEPPVNAVAPSISGAPIIGQTLTGDAGSWAGAPAPDLAFQWLRNGAVISGATSTSYTIAAVDEGRGISFRVRATNAHGSAEAVSTSVTVTNGVSIPSLLTIDDIPQNRMSYPPEASGLAPIPLSGMADPGAVIEVRDYSSAAPSAWVEVAVADGAGDWSGVMNAAPQGYFRPEVRLRDNAAVTAQTVTELGVGPVWMFESQSIIDMGLTTFADQLPVKINPVDARMLMLSEITHNAPDSRKVVEIGPSERYTSPVAAMSNALAEAGDPGMVYTVLFATKSGTTQRALANDSASARSWADLQAMVDLVEACGSHVSSFASMHYNADAGPINWLTPLWGKALRDGTAIPLGSGVDFGPGPNYNQYVEARGGDGGSFMTARPIISTMRFSTSTLRRIRRAKAFSARIRPRSVSSGRRTRRGIDALPDLSGRWLD